MITKESSATVRNEDKCLPSLPGFSIEIFLFIDTKMNLMTSICIGDSVLLCKPLFIRMSTVLRYV